MHRPSAPDARERVLNNAEIVKFWKAAEAERIEFTSLLKVLLLTGCRLSEVAEMTRAELSDDLSIWTIPGARTKNKKTHVVPLPPLARDIIGKVLSESDWVFTTTGNAPVYGGSKIKERLDKAMDVPHWRLHDLRRTAATGMAGLKVPPDIVEAALNHISGAKKGVAGTYNRYAYDAEKKDALERWAAHIEWLLAGRPTNVVPLRKTGGDGETA